MTPLINGITWSYPSITTTILGQPIAGITAINYGEKQEIEDNMAAGNFAVNRSFGGVKYEGSIKLMMEEVEALQLAAPNGRLQEIPEFNIIVAFEQNGRVAIHKLTNCRLKDNIRDSKTGDMTVEVEIALAIGQIKWK